MKIIKRGNTAMKFICNKCGTIFEAEKEECKPVCHTGLQPVTLQAYNYKIKCPVCDNIVYHT